MEINEAKNAKERLNRLAHLALYHQGVWISLVAVLLVFKPTYYQEMGKMFGVLALSSSFIASKI